MVRSIVMLLLISGSGLIAGCMSSDVQKGERGETVDYQLDRNFPNGR